MVKSRHIRIPKNYIDFMSSRLNMTGKRNYRKLLILQAIFEKGHLESRDIYRIAGRGCTYESIRASLTRLVRYRYLNRLEDHKYSLQMKGRRFIYAVKELFPEVFQKSIDEIYR